MKAIVITIVVIIVLLSISLFISSLQTTTDKVTSSDSANDVSELTCLVDDDCTWYPSGCACDCENRAPINKQFKNKYEGVFTQETCGDEYTWEMCEYCCPSLSKCVNGMCAFVEVDGLCGYDN